MPSDGIDDVVPDAEDMAWTALIACEQCGDAGLMHATGEPRDQHVWTCQTCETETVHDAVLKTRDAVTPRQ